MLLSFLSMTFRDPLSPETIVDAMKVRLAEVRTRLEELRCQPVSPEVIEEVLTAEFERERLARRLRVLGEEGVLMISVRAPCGPADLLRIALHEVEECCARRGITVELHADPVLGPLWLDSDQIVEALRSILDNAIEAVGQGGKVAARAAREDDAVVLCVGDDGPPFDPEILPLAFAPGVSTRRAGPGVGIGLTIVHRVAQALGGVAQIKSSAGWTEVSLRLPRTLERARASRWVFPLSTAA